MNEKVKDDELLGSSFNYILDGNVEGGSGGSGSGGSSSGGSSSGGGSSGGGSSSSGGNEGGSGQPTGNNNSTTGEGNNNNFPFWSDKLWSNIFLSRIFADLEIDPNEVSVESIIPFPPLFSEIRNQLFFPFLIAPDKIFMIIILPISGNTILLGKEIVTISEGNLSIPSAFKTYRTYSFMNPSDERAFLCIERNPTITIIDISPYLQWDQNTIPSSNVKIFAINPTKLAITPSLGYAGSDTFALINQQNVMVISLNNTFPEVLIGNKDTIAFQNNGLIGSRPAIAFPPRLTQTNKPVLIYPNGDYTTSEEINQELLTSIDRTFLASLSPQYIGYDTFTEVSNRFIWNTNFRATSLWVGDWIKDETNWISVMSKTNYPITSAPPIETMHPSIANSMDGKEVYFKHVNSVCLTQLYHYHGQASFYSPYGSYTEVSSEGWWLTDFITETTTCVVLTAGGQRQSQGNTVDVSSVVVLSPPTFVPQFGSWFGSAAFSFQQGENRSYRVSLIRVAHPQFYSQYLASVPALESLTQEDKFAVFYCSLKYPKKPQKWKVALVRVDDPTKREIVADMMKHITSTEKWEWSHDRNNWQEIPEGSTLSGNEAWIRVKIPRAVLEWKKDVFQERFGNNTPFRIVFISEPTGVRR